MTSAIDEGDDHARSGRRRRRPWPRRSPSAWPAAGRSWRSSSAWRAPLGRPTLRECSRALRSATCRRQIYGCADVHMTRTGRAAHEPERLSRETAAAPPRAERRLTPEAQRALAEAEERRRQRAAEAADRARESAAARGPIPSATAIGRRAASRPISDRSVSRRRSRPDGTMASVRMQPVPWPVAGTELAPHSPAVQQSSITIFAERTQFGARLRGLNRSPADALPASSAVRHPHCNHPGHQAPRDAMTHARSTDGRSPAHRPSTQAFQGRERHRRHHLRL